MPNSSQAKRRAKQNKKRELHNASQRSAVRTVIKKVLKILRTDDRKAVQTAFQKAVCTLDKASVRRIIHPNKAGRLKSRLNQKLKNLV
ncbi:30S ribosomal protein S20 [Coxiella endosymbiont of Amblyomma nuttalli]|uniref:30S ribosomal protein S20 n=1 Tax=Coxiella endosymbiont of Amblyomma nuttalli TaxID=2749996 RepID=UPI001BAAEB24|nr:30S ribosomal protein S20 [Coxiella endosymbiont of Amblyomma nuttalli]